MKVLKKICLAALAVLTLGLAACGGSAGDDSSQPSIPGGEVEPELKSIFVQPKFDYGFSIAYMSDKNWIDYNGSVDHTLSRWGINEEGSQDLINADTVYTEEGDFKVFRSPNGSKVMKVNNETGAFYMEVNASVDYGERPRQNGESWPHLLFTQNYNANEIPNLDQMSELRMQIDFDFIKFEDKMGALAEHGLHAAQFQWYVAIQNVNPDSPDYGDWFWLGLQFFDNRYTWCPQNLIVDGGKDTATGKAIYTLDMREVMNRQVVEEGGHYEVDYDILPHVKAALEELKTFEDLTTLRNTELSDLQIFHTNIGWELPGTYDVAVQVNGWDFVYRLAD